MKRKLKPQGSQEIAVKSSFIIPGRLPGMNEIIDEARTNKYSSNGLKRVMEDDITIAMLMHKAKPVHGRVIVSVWWYEPDARRDPDNIHAGIKFILDAMVSNGLIDGDGQKHIAGIIHHVAKDKNNPRVYVEYENQQSIEAREVQMMSSAAVSEIVAAMGRKNDDAANEAVADKLTMMWDSEVE
jgi:Holliday junction resolvase RusA-like endonuclease